MEDSLPLVTDKVATVVTKTAISDLILTDFATFPAFSCNTAYILATLRYDKGLYASHVRLYAPRRITPLRGDGDGWL